MQQMETYLLTLQLNFCSVLVDFFPPESETLQQLRTRSVYLMHYTSQSFLLYSFTLLLYDGNIQLNYVDCSLLSKFRNLFIEGLQIWPCKFSQLPVWLSSLKIFSMQRTYKYYDIFFLPLGLLLCKLHFRLNGTVVLQRPVPRI